MKRVIAALLLILHAAPARADDINYRDFDDDGFGSIATLLQSMTAEQRADIIKQALANEQDLQKMTPQQQAKLLKQLHAIMSTIDFNKIDPQKLDTGKSQDIGPTQNNLNLYLQKYQQGKISNPVVIPPAGHQ